MKKSRSPRFRDAFTLIELLVVIAIISMLAGLSFTGIQKTMVSAKRAAAKHDMVQIANGIQFFYTEYGRYPAAGPYVTGTTDAIYGTSAVGNDQIIDILRCPPGASSAVTDQNPRQIKFLEPKISDVRKGAVNRTDRRWYDPWGTQFIIFIDGDYDGDITWSGAFSRIGSETGSSQTGIGVASVGYYYVKNNQKVSETTGGPRDFSAQTDLLSWQ